MIQDLNRKQYARMRDLDAKLDEPHDSRLIIDDQKGNKSQQEAHQNLSYNKMDDFDRRNNNRDSMSSSE